MMKVLFGIALRRTTGFVESLLRLVSLYWAVPDFSMLSRRRKALKVNIRYRGSDGPPHLLIYGTGTKGEGEWQARVHVADGVRKLFELGRSSRCDQAVLGKMPAKGVDHLSALAEKYLLRPKQHRAGLLVFGFQSHKAHCRRAPQLPRSPRHPRNRSSGA